MAGIEISTAGSSAAEPACVEDAMIAPPDAPKDMDGMPHSLSMDAPTDPYVFPMTFKEGTEKELEVSCETGTDFKPQAATIMDKHEKTVATQCLPNEASDSEYVPDSTDSEDSSEGLTNLVLSSKKDIRNVSDKPVLA